MKKVSAEEFIEFLDKVIDKDYNARKLKEEIEDRINQKNILDSFDMNNGAHYKFNKVYIVKLISNNNIPEFDLDKPYFRDR